MQKVVVSQGGRVVIPADLRQKLNINQGDELFCEVRNGELILASKQERIKRVQEGFYATLSPDAKKRSVSDELLEERREEVRKEQEEMRGKYKGKSGKLTNE